MEARVKREVIESYLEDVIAEIRDLKEVLDKPVWNDKDRRHAIIVMAGIEGVLTDLYNKI